MKRIFFFMMMLLSANATAECVVVSGLQTYWQNTFSVFGFNFGDKYHLQLQVTTGPDNPRVVPGDMQCLSEQVGDMVCGYGLETTIIDSAGIDDGESFYLESTTTKGVLSQSWTVLKENGAVILYARDGAKWKVYNGIIDGDC